MKRTLIALALATALSAQATEYHGVLHGLSKHQHETDRNGNKWNEVNLGAGLRFKQSEDLSYQVGIYNNSQRHTSVYALADWTPLHYSIVSAGVSGGAVTGYEVYPVVPVATFVVRLTLTSRMDVMVRYLPSITPKLEGVTAIEASWRF